MSEQTTALATTPNNPIGQMLQAITAQGITPESAAALEKMTELYLRVESVNARKAFIDAKSALQDDLPPIHATRFVPNNDGGVRYRFAPYEEIMRAVKPFLVKHGFSVSFSQEISESRIAAICTLSHIQGHSESNTFAVRPGKGPPGASESQADGAASTYAKRFALCNCLNITVDLDDDARLKGAKITAEQAADLERRLVAVRGNIPNFLKMAGAASFSDIDSAKLSVLLNALEAKERLSKKGNSSTLPPAAAAPTCPAGGSTATPLPAKAGSAAEASGNAAAGDVTPAPGQTPEPAGEDPLGEGAFTQVEPDPPIEHEAAVEMPDPCPRTWIVDMGASLCGRTMEEVDKRLRIATPKPWEKLSRDTQMAVLQRMRNGVFFSKE